MKIFRLTVKGHNSDSKLVVYDSSEGRLMRDYDNAVRSRWTRFAEIAVVQGPSFIKRSHLLDALNGRTENWTWVPIVGYEREDEQRNAA